MSILQNDLEAIALSRFATQYGESTKLRAMLSALIAELTELQDATFDVMARLNLEDATGWGLDVIGERVGLARPLVDGAAFEYFGFVGAGSELGFGDEAAPEVGGRLLSEHGAVSGQVPLEDEDYRLMIRAKILANKTSARPEDVLEIIRLVIPTATPTTYTQQAFASATITFGRLLSTIEKGLVVDAGILPTPLGVGVAYADSLGADAFGFAGSVGSGFADEAAPTVGGTFAAGL